MVIRAYANDTGFIDRIESDDLPDGELAILRKRIGSALWSPARLFKVARERDWPPIIFVRGRPPLLPPPCAQPFEPTPLNGADPTLHALGDLLLEQADPAMHDILRRRARWSELAKVNLFVTLLLLLQTAAFAILLWRWPHALQPSMLLFAASYALFVYAAVYFLCRRNWYIVPGGVVIRRASAIGAMQLRVFSPANGLLVTGYRQVHLIIRDTGKTLRANVSPFEIAVLLAVWQSPIPAPDVSKLVDLQ